MFFFQNELKLSNIFCSIFYDVDHFTIISIHSFFIICSIKFFFYCISHDVTVICHYKIDLIILPTNFSWHILERNQIPFLQISQGLFFFVRLNFTRFCGAMTDCLFYDFLQTYNLKKLFEVLHLWSIFLLYLYVIKRLSAPFIYEQWHRIIIYTLFWVDLASDAFFIWTRVKKKTFF